jgi:hypothetical protein
MAFNLKRHNSAMNKRHFIPLLLPSAMVAPAADLQKPIASAARVFADRDGVIAAAGPAAARATER